MKAKKIGLNFNMKNDPEIYVPKFSRPKLKLLIPLLLFVFQLPSLALAQSGPKPKGIVLVVIDDIGYGDIDCLSPSDLDTPSLDSLCNQSLRFTDFHVGTTCAPTRASLMTGRHVNAGGVWHTIAGRELLRENEQTMADVFQANGWRTGIFGKWHLCEGFPFSPRFRGFDLSVIHGGGGIGQGPDYWQNDYYSGVGFDGKSNPADTYFKNGQPVVADKFCTDYWFENAKQFVKESVASDKPFFCYVPTNAAHGPFNAPNGFKKGFDGLIENIDTNMGAFDKFLDDEGIKDDVLLIFTTDNGTAGKRLGGLRGKKGSHYDGGHNVPCFWRWKNGGMAGSADSSRDIASLTAAMDLLPTFIDLFQLKRPKSKNVLHGISLKEMLQNPSYKRRARTIVVDTQRAAKLVKWKKACIMQDEITDGKIAHKWRMCQMSADSKPELFDFSIDRDTNDNIAQSNSELIKTLSGEYDSWWSTISAGSDSYPAFVVDSNREPELTLMSHSWIGQRMSPWHQNAVLKGTSGTGVHAIRFAKTGNYRFELRRWPREDGGAIASKSKSGKGTILPITKASLSLSGIEEKTKAIEAGAASVVFNLAITSTEPTKITTKLLDENDKRINGAYYMYIKSTDEKQEQTP